MANKQIPEIRKRKQSNKNVKKSKYGLKKTHLKNVKKHSVTIKYAKMYQTI